MSRTTQQQVENQVRSSNRDAAAGPDDQTRYCWVCFATDEDDRNLLWVKPCNCRGTTKWVHQNCLQRWVDEKQKGNSFRRVACPQCQTEYIIVLPNMGLLANVLEGIDTLIRKGSPFLAAGVLVGSFYWTAVTFGAVTVLQVMGHKEGLALMENSDQIFLMVALPAIPVCLVLGRMIRWEEQIFRLLVEQRRRNVPLLELMLPMPEDDLNSVQPGDYSQTNRALSDTLSTTRVLCGALLLPSIATVFGRLFFDNVKNNLHRTLLGGFTFVVMKGAFKIYFKHKQFLRKKQRKILDYSEENVRKYVRSPRFNNQNMNMPPNF